MDVIPSGGKGNEQVPADPNAWEKEIEKAGRGEGGAYRFSDGSLLEGGDGGVGNVGGGAFVVESGGEESDVECGIGNMATGWDGEIAGMA